MSAFDVTIISTGGTIEKTYHQQSGTLSNRMSVLDHMLDQVEIPDLHVRRVALMNKDSLEMDPADHDLIAATAQQEAQTADGVVVVHGTDRLAVSGEATLRLGTPPVPIVFTGAMRPYELRTTDALQNLVEALLAVRMVGPGVYAVMHNRVLRFPGVQKDYGAGTFTSSSD